VPFGGETGSGQRSEGKSAMIRNPVVDALLSRKSIRKYRTEQPSDEVLLTIVRAGQQAPFAYQLCSLLLARHPEKNPYGAPLLFTVCVDAHKLELVMAQRGWHMVSNDLSLLVLGMQDAALVAENMVIAAESLGLGSCFLGAAPYYAEEIAQEYKLPQRVFPLVQLVMGYPAETPPARPRYPTEFTLFEDEYPHLDAEAVRKAMKSMDEAYLMEGYYRRLDAKIPLDDRQDEFTYDSYSWTEHISRKAGQWEASPQVILEQFAKRGFYIQGLGTR
jgi:nitroreductase